MSSLPPWGRAAIWHHHGVDSLPHTDMSQLLIYSCKLPHMGYNIYIFKIIVFFQQLPQSRAEQSKVNHHHIPSTIYNYSILCQLYLGGHKYHCSPGEILSHFYVRQSSESQEKELLKPNLTSLCTHLLVQLKKNFN